MKTYSVYTRSSSTTVVKKGPLDIQRERDLAKTEQAIQDALHEKRNNALLVDDCLLAADLARQLERPRTEVDGLFQRADQVAAKHGTRHQLLRCAYEWAWTTYWWFEDFERFNELYGMAEDRAKNAQNAYHLELLTNLWSLLFGCVDRGQLNTIQANLDSRTKKLRRELKNLSQREDLPSTSLHARTLRLHVELILKLAANEPTDSTLLAFRSIVDSCDGFVGFPVEPLIGILTELGERFDKLPAYEELFDTIVAVQAKRQSEVSIARMLLRRGEQQIKGGQTYKSIRTLGLSLRHLYKHESRRDLVHALYLCAYAFECASLLWAARGTLLSAASIATNELWTYGQITSPQAACFKRLKWLELRLGRVPQALTWHELDASARLMLSKQVNIPIEPSEDEIAFDAVLGLLLLKADPWDLKRLSSLPGVLDRLGLHSAWAALLYALGYEDELRKHNFLDAARDVGETRNFFLKWRDQPASSEIAEKPLLNEEQRIVLKSHLLGCAITLTTDNMSPCIELAESVLAALESLLSTAIVTWTAIREPELTISVRKSDFAEQLFEFEIQSENGRTHIDIRCSIFDPHSMSRDTQRQLGERIVGLFVEVSTRIVTSADIIKTFETLLRDELAFDRSISFSGSFVTLGNLLGSNPKNRLSHWFDPKDTDYPPNRSKAWDADYVPAPIPNVDSSVEPLTVGVGNPPQSLLKTDRVKHSEVRTISLIREHLWDKAKWTGVAFGTPEGAGLPLLMPMFGESNPAKQIFKFWNLELGSDDSIDRLRISIVRGINKSNPSWYRVIIGSNVALELRNPGTKYGVFISRVNTINAKSDANLDRFLASYSKTGRYLVAGSVGTKASLSSGRAPEQLDAPHLIKRHLHVRNAWEIGKNDPDTAGISVGDTPIFPEDQKNPPVLELLRWKQGRPDSR